MSDSRSSEQVAQCAAMVTSGWHRYRCTNNAKTTAIPSWGSAHGSLVQVCGVHARARYIDSDGPRFRSGEGRES